MTQSLNVTGTTLSDVINLTAESYLVFVYGQARDNYAVQEFTPKQKRQNEASKDLLNETGIETGVIGKVGMAIYTSPIVQNFASKNLPNALLGRLNSSIYDIMSDGRISVQEVAEDFIGNCTNAIDNIATDLGFPLPTGLYSALMPGGTGVPSKDFGNLFSKQCQKENEELKQLENNKISSNGEILKFKLVTKDSENWDTEVPTRKTEKGMYLAPVLGNQNLTKSYSINIVNNPNKGILMYEERDKLYTLRDKKVKFDIYVYDSDVGAVRDYKNCVFSNISIDTEGKNSLVLDLSITQIPEYEVKIDTNLDKDIKRPSTGNTATGKKNASKGTKTKSSSKVTQAQASVKQYTQEKVYNKCNKAKDDYLTQKNIYQNPNKSIEERKTAKAIMQNQVKQTTKLLNETHKTKGWKQQYSTNDIEKAFNSGHDFKDPRRK